MPKLFGGKKSKSESAGRRGRYSDEIRGNVDPRSVVYTHDFPEIPQSALLMIQQQQYEAESITGIKAFSGGVSGDALGTTATGIRSALDAVSKRELNIIRRIAKGLVEVGHHILAMNSVFLNDEEIIRITDEHFVTIRRESLAGRFNIKLKVSTAEANNMKANQFSFMLQTLGNTLPWDVTKIIMAELARLQEMPDIAQQLLAYTPQPDPLAEEMRQLELEYKKAEIALMQSQAQENSAKAQLQGAKVPVENARAQSLQGDADNKALEFMQKDTGLSHERDMQKEVLKGENNLRQTSLAKNIDTDGKVLQKLMDKTLPDMSQEPNMFNQGMSNDPTTSAPSR